MKVIDIILLIANIFLTIYSAKNAHKSEDYFNKSKNLQNYTELNKARIETQKILKSLPDALEECSYIARGAKAINLGKKISKIGKEINNSLIVINSSIPPEYIKRYNEIVNQKDFKLQEYINSYINGSVIKKSEIDIDKYNKCNEVVTNIDNFLNELANTMENKLQD